MNREEIYTVTYDVDSSHELTEESIYKFTIDHNLRVIGVGTRPEDDLYDVYITYINEDRKFKVGKVLFVNLADTSTARMFDFMASKTISRGKQIE